MWKRGICQSMFWRSRVNRDFRDVGRTCFEKRGDCDGFADGSLEGIFNGPWSTSMAWWTAHWRAAWMATAKASWKACDGILDGNWEGILDSSLEGILDGTCKGILVSWGLRWHHGRLLWSYLRWYRGRRRRLRRHHGRLLGMPLFSGMLSKKWFSAVSKEWVFSFFRDRHFYQYDIGTGRNDQLDPFLTASWSCPDTSLHGRCQNDFKKLSDLLLLAVFCESNIVHVQHVTV